MNYKNVSESKDFEPIPPGDYLVKIEKVDVTTTKKSGRPLIKIRYKVTSGKFAGRILFDQITLFQGEESGAGITKHFLHMIEEPFENDFEVDPANWTGKELTVGVIIDEKYKNNKIKSHSEASIPF